MSRFNSPVVRSSGGINVYTGLAGVAALILLVGCLAMVFHNIQYSSTGTSENGAIFKVLETR
ncbi:MAG: hypothetical protein P8L37_06860 [Phycisphaerales bacterium]|nr:hypothetical protein [Phycisphaerales bacterium]